MQVFICYYTITFLYCMIMASRRWNKDVRAGGLGVTPAMDTMAIIMMCWALAPVDIFLTWMRVYKEAEEAKRRIERENNIF